MSSTGALGWWLVDHGAWVWRALVLALGLLGSFVPAWWSGRRARAAAGVVRSRFRETGGLERAAEGSAAVVRGKLRTGGKERFDTATAPPTLEIEIDGATILLSGPFTIECGTRERWSFGERVECSLDEGDEVLAAGTWRSVAVVATDGGYREAPEMSFQIHGAPGGRPLRLAAVGSPRIRQPHPAVRAIASGASAIVALVILQVVGALAIRVPVRSPRDCNDAPIGTARLVALASPRHAEARRIARDELRTARHLGPEARSRLLALDTELGGCEARVATLDERRDLAALVAEAERCGGASLDTGARAALEAGWFDRASALYDRVAADDVSYGELERTVVAHLLAGHPPRAIDAARKGALLLRPRDPVARPPHPLPPPRMASTATRRERLECVADALELRFGPERDAARARLRAAKSPECQLLSMDATPPSERRNELERLGGRFGVRLGTTAQRNALELLSFEGDPNGDYAPPAFPEDTSNLAWSLVSDVARVLRDRVPALELQLARTLHDIAEPTRDQLRARIDVGSTAASLASLAGRHDEARKWVERIIEDVGSVPMDGRFDRDAASARAFELRAAVETRAGALPAAHEAASRSRTAWLPWLVDLLEGKRHLPPPPEPQGAFRYNPGFEDLLTPLSRADSSRIASLIRCGNAGSSELLSFAASAVASNAAPVLDALRDTPEPASAHTNAMYGHYAAVLARARLVRTLGDAQWAADLDERADAFARALALRSHAVALLVLLDW